MVISRAFRDPKARVPEFTFGINKSRTRLEMLKQKLASPLGIGPGVGELPTLQELQDGKTWRTKQRELEFQDMLLKQQKFSKSPEPGIFRLSIMIIGQFIGPGSLAIADFLKYLNKLKFGTRHAQRPQYGTSWQLPPTLGPRIAAQMDKYTRRVIEMRISVLTDMACQYVAFALNRPCVPGFLPQDTQARLDRLIYVLNRQDRNTRKSLMLQTEMLHLFRVTLDRYEEVVKEIQENGPKEARKYGISEVSAFQTAAQRIRRGLELARESGLLAAEAQQRVWDLNFDAVNIKYHTLRNRWVSLRLVEGKLTPAPPRIGEIYELDSVPRFPGAFAPDWKLSQYRGDIE